MSLEERVENLERLVALLAAGYIETPPPTLEEQHIATVARVKAARERGGLKA